MSKMEFFLTFVNSFHLLTNVTKKCIVDITEVIDPPLIDT